MSNLHKTLWWCSWLMEGWGGGEYKFTDGGRMMALKDDSSPFGVMNQIRMCIMQLRRNVLWNSTRQRVVHEDSKRYVVALRGTTHSSGPWARGALGAVQRKELEAGPSPPGTLLSTHLYAAIDIRSAKDAAEGPPYEISFSSGYDGHASATRVLEFSAFSRLSVTGTVGSGEYPAGPAPLPFRWHVGKTTSWPVLPARPTTSLGQSSLTGSRDDVRTPALGPPLEPLRRYSIRYHLPIGSGIWHGNIVGSAPLSLTCFRHCRRS
ncbi:hypothetical protein BC826DRAFT_967225 [Russula brevipes]|nr:hypothetical protein BC826DRAFT_967225 [Russula brevipes]